jgi:hypothetical protein
VVNQVAVQVLVAKIQTIILAYVRGASVFLEMVELVSPDLPACQGIGQWKEAAAVVLVVVMMALQLALRPELVAVGTLVQLQLVVKLITAFGIV